jgi:hypothetical protein
MSHILRSTILLLAGMALSCASLFGQRITAGAPARTLVSYRAPYFGGYGLGYGFGGYSYPLPGNAFFGPAVHEPNYWWVSHHPIADPRQEGYNPSAGYEWDSIVALILETTPEKADVTLNGTYLGTADKLGPFQLPLGQHTLRIEAPGYQSADVVLDYDRPGTQTLDVRLKPLTASAKPAPHF